jgi:hypothetical protein
MLMAYHAGGAFHITKGIEINTHLSSKVESIFAHSISVGDIS